ncbi:MAG: hypothetical protein WDZ30_09290 [Cellvibrionaceae bacterium]
MTNRIVVGLLLGACVSATAYAEETKSEATKIGDTDKRPAKTENTDNNKQSDAAIRLESVFVGDKEQPAISYFIPWQGIGTPDKLIWNVEEKHDKALDVVDRDIMLRSIHFYGEMKLEAPDSQ